MSDLLPYEESGKKSSNYIVIFLHGWPDTPALWDKVIPSFDKDYFILNISYPNYSEKSRSTKGLDFEEMAARIKATIDHVNDKKRKVILVTHDWGAIYGYYLDYLYPGYITDMTALDVGAKFNVKKFLIIFYQFVLIIGYIIGGPIGRFLTQWIMKYAKYQPSWKNKVDSTWNYPFYYCWKKLFKTGLNEEKAILTGYKPSCPIAFVWGTKKPFQYFTDAWISLLAKDPKNEVHSLNCGHWIQKQQPQFVVDLVIKRITRTQS